MSDEPAGESNDDATRVWLRKTLAQACQLTADDLSAIDELRSGTAMLIGIAGPRRGERLLLWRETVTVGRDPGALFHLPDPAVSRRHAILTRTEDSYEIIDGESLNGTHVNGQPIHSTRLTNGAEVRFGRNTFLFVHGRT